MTHSTQGSEHDATASRAAGGDVVGGRYRLVRVVGVGGMGTVWEAINTWTERRVAVKFMEAPSGAGRATASSERVERFLREARATARVRHPNVVDVLDMGNDPEHGGLYIVYDFLDGEPLRAALDRRGALSFDEARALLVPAMEGVAEAHRCGVVHRDLKPENIFLAREPDGRVVPKVIDFGIARTNDPDGASLTRTGEAVGTVRYMAPEQCRGAKDIDARADVWAFGALWFEALTGRHAFDGDGYNQVLSAVLTTDAPSIRALRLEVSPRVAHAIDRALARDRDTRLPTVRDFLDALTHGATATPDIAPLVPSRPRLARIVAATVVLASAALVVARSGRTPVAPASHIAPPTHIESPQSVPTPARAAPTLAPPTPAPIVRTVVTPRVVAPPTVRPRPRRVQNLVADPTPPSPAPASPPPRVAPRLPNGAPVLDP